MMTFEMKKDRIKEKNGIKSFGCNLDDLKHFTEWELKELNDTGLISDYYYHSELLRRSNDPKYASQVQYRKTGATHDIMNGVYGKPVGWFRTKENPGGWAIHKLDKNDTAWFNNQKESLTDVYRTVSYNGHTGLVKMSKKHGTVYFFDNIFYENTDLITFECKGVRIETLFFD